MAANTNFGVKFIYFLGFKFAMLEMKSFVAKIIREFVLEPVDTPETISFKMDIVLRPTKNVRVKFRKRLPSKTKM